MNRALPIHFVRFGTAIHSTSDRSNPTAKQEDALSTINDLPQGKYDEMVALIAVRYGEDAADLECTFDLAEIPLIDESPAAYFYLECDAIDDIESLALDDGGFDDTDDD